MVRVWLLIKEEGFVGGKGVVVDQGGGASRW